MSERLVLALDGSTRVCSAALLTSRRPAATTVADPGPGDADWKVVARRSERDSRGQARVLLALVDEMLSEVGGGPRDLGAVVVGTGPGTFTGVRIAVATGRALGLALAVPVLGVSTLAALAVTGTSVLERAAEGGGGPAVIGVGGGTVDPGAPAPLLVPVVDARRGQVFFGVYEATDEYSGGLGEEGQPVRRWARSGSFGVCDRDALGVVLAGPALIVAEDCGLVSGLPAGTVVMTADVQAEQLVLGQRHLDEPGEAPAGRRCESWLSGMVYGAPAGMACGAPTGRASWGPGEERAGAPRPGDVGTPESVKPIYVRSPDADVHITKMRDPWAADAGRGNLTGGR